jgi:hypothetical protein
MAKNDKLSWEKDFAEFMNKGETQVPDALSTQVLSQIHKELNPSATNVFLKIAFIQFAVGSVSLLFCPQFGISLTSSQGIMPYLMKFGEGVCMLGCGAIFTAFSLLIASFALRPEEVRALKQHELLHLLSLATLSLGAFLCLGGEIVLTLGFVWILGAIIGGIFTLELGWALRAKLARRATI